MAEAETARQAAEAETARQAVILAAGLISLLIMMPLYRRMIRRQAETMREEMTDRFDPALRAIADAERRRAAARAVSRRWQRAAGWLWPVSTPAAVWALRRAETAGKRGDDG